MPSAAWVAAALTAVVALVDWWAVARDDRRTERWAKPAVVGGLLVVALLAGAAGSPAGRWVLLALALGLVGDVLLLPDVDRFVGGLLAFLLGHLAWVAACVTVGLDRPGWGGWVSPSSASPSPRGGGSCPRRTATGERGWPVRSRRTWSSSR